MRRRWGIISLGLAFVVLLGLSAIQQSGGRLFGARTNTLQIPTPDAQTGFVFEGIDERNILGIRITEPVSERTLILLRAENGEWALPQFPEETADPDQIALISRTMVLLPYYRTISIDNDAELPQYGLIDENPFSLRIEVIFADGTGEALVTGNLTQTVDAYYALVSERPIVYLIEPRAIEFLRSQLNNPPIRLTSD